MKIGSVLFSTPSHKTQLTMNLIKNQQPSKEQNKTMRVKERSQVDDVKEK